MTKPKILVYDIESCGINAFNADLGYVITFGYIWLDDFEKGKKPKTISIADFPLFKKDCQDDTELLKKSIEVLKQADCIIHHYGGKFDEPFIRTRSLIQGLDHFPEVKELDTCKLAWKKLKLSSNRLANIAKVLKCKWRKLEKGDGWPKWWFSFAKGSSKHDKAMRKYCGIDVMTLAEISIKMRPYWPESFVNFSQHVDDEVCKKCGNEKLQNKEKRVIGAYQYQLLRCNNCGYSYNKQKISQSRTKMR